MEEAIERAIQAGYKPGYKVRRLNDSIVGIINEGEIWDNYALLLDPLFWKALGKAEGWRMQRIESEDGSYAPEWVYVWHHFIDHLANGGTLDDFFKDLLTKK